jgi:hypothetical protein
MSDDDAQNRAPTKVGLPAMSLRRPITEPSLPAVVPDRLGEMERRLSIAEAKLVRLERKLRRLGARRG